MRAECDIRETIFPNAGPGTSAFMICTVSDSVCGRTARAKTSTPIPPIKCVKLRQKRLECAKASTSVSILAPVVVNPLAVSKNASTIDGISPFKTKGSEPKKDKRIQDKDTITNPSLAYKLFTFGIFFVNIYPMIPVSRATTKKLAGYFTGSVYIRLTIKGMTKSIASI